MAAKSPTEFFVITEKASKEGRKTVRERIVEYLSLDQKLASDLSVLFSGMADKFFRDNQTIVEFDGRYTPGKGEVFEIKDFKLDQAVTKAAKSPLTTTPLSLRRSPFPQIKAIIATEVNSPLRVIFQEFRVDQIIRQGYAFVNKFLHGKETFDLVESSGIAVGSDIDAVYDDGSLYFRSYYTANRFLDLTEYFKDATDEEIRDLLKADTLCTENENDLLDQTDAVMRRKFAIIKKTEILNLVTPEQIKAAAANQGMEVQIDDTGDHKRIVIPAERAEAKELLDFLCQARFIGPLTNELFIANSYRPAKKSGQSSQAATAPKKVVALKKASKKSAKKKSAKKKTP